MLHPSNGFYIVLFLDANCLCDKFPVSLSGFRICKLKEWPANFKLVPIMSSLSYFSCYNPQCAKYIDFLVCTWVRTPCAENDIINVLDEPYFGAHILSNSLPFQTFEIPKKNTQPLISVRGLALGLLRSSEK